MSGNATTVVKRINGTTEILNQVSAKNALGKMTS